MAKKYYDGKEQSYQIVYDNIEKIFNSVMREEYKKGNILFTKKSNKKLYIEMALEVNFELICNIFESVDLYEICKNKVKEVSDFYNGKFKKSQNTVTQ